LLKKIKKIKKLQASKVVYHTILTYIFVNSTHSPAWGISVQEKTSPGKPQLSSAFGKNKHLDFLDFPGGVDVVEIGHFD